MRFILLHILAIFLIVILTQTETNAIHLMNDYKKQREVSLIFEVDGAAGEHAAYIKRNMPDLTVVATYSLLFNGLAVTGPQAKVEKLVGEDFVKGIHPVYTYEAVDVNVSPIEIEPFAHSVKQKFTGKGVKVAVVDTGVDYRHPDLAKNFKGGFDLVDLDNDPMETMPEQGMPTLHGTHVAGIIAANGRLKGIAPDAEIYAYRALGPGGMGSSIQVIAAMEQAVRDGVDIINLSLGNAVNGPDYPTSKAVDAAAKLGIAVIVANGNSGPTDWTIGAPATAPLAFAVGAYEAEKNQPYLYVRAVDKTIKMAVLPNAEKWALERDYAVALAGDEELRGKVVLIELAGEDFLEQIKQAESAGAVAIIVYNSEANNHLQTHLNAEMFTLPVAFISEKNAQWLAKNEGVFLQTNTLHKMESVTDFSSRGPVTMNWAIKPDILAPGADVLSTVPGGYEALSGTSMATPYIAGVVALLKEAQADWSNEQIYGALKTTARTLKDESGEFIKPNVQGTGLVNIDAAINTKTIITNPQLAFGKISRHLETKFIEVEIENMSAEQQQYHFSLPKKQKGLTWTLPQSFTIEPYEKRIIEVGLKINGMQLDEGIHQDWLKLNREGKQFLLPYLFVNKTADYPKVMGFNFYLHPFTKDTYKYELFIPEKVKSVHIQLYEPGTWLYVGTLQEWRDLSVGMNEGEILKRRINYEGHYDGLIVIQLENGEYVTYQTEIILD